MFRDVMQKMAIFLSKRLPCFNLTLICSRVPPVVKRNDGMTYACNVHDPESFRWEIVIEWDVQCAVRKFS